EPGTIGYGQVMSRSDEADVPVDLSAGIFYVEPAGLRLFRRTSRTVLSTKCLYFIKVFSPLRAGEIWRPIGPELRSIVERERLHLRNPWEQRRDRNRRSAWCHLVRAGSEGEDIRHVRVSTVACPLREESHGNLCTDRSPSGL